MARRKAADVTKWPVDSSRLRDRNNQWLVGLFKKPTPTGWTKSGYYTLDEARECFLESATEYEAAMKMVTSWEHWTVIADAPHNRSYIEQWRQEKEFLDKTKAKKLLEKKAEEGNVTAQKILLEYQDIERKKEAALEAGNEKRIKTKTEEEKKAEMLQERLEKITKLRVV